MSTTPEEKLELEIKATKAQILEAIRSKADAQTVADLQSQLDAIDKRLVERHSSYEKGETLGTLLQKSDNVQRGLHDKRGSATIEIPREMFLEQKTTIDSSALGSATSGVLQIDRTSGIVGEARQSLRIRDVLTSRPTSLQIIDFVRVNSAASPASLQQTEGNAKQENAVTFTTSSERVRTIATTLPCSRQAIEDYSELEGFLRTTLAYQVRIREELEFLHGGGGSTDINGLVTQATALNTSLALPTWNKADLVSAAIEQVELAKEIEPTFCVISPQSYWEILRSKNVNRDYVFGSRGTQADPFWGLQVIRTTSMGASNVLVGSGNPAAAEIRDRMGVTVEISTEHSDFFARNLIMIRAESRVCLVVYRPASFIFASSLTTSP